MARVAVAMSGGVDSSVAAALLVREGHEVVGLTMDVWPSPPPDGSGRRTACCGEGAIDDARTVAARLGIRHYVLNMRREFESHVIDYFCDEYTRGRTPNPCVACNQHVKFTSLLARAEAMGCGLLATGHHARVAADEASGRHVLLRGVDPHKDQSYVLCTVAHDRLARLRFPVGGRTKDEVRELARGLRLPVADKADSQDVCFISSGGYADLVVARRPRASSPGYILDRGGRVLGSHGGLVRFTVGQRRGLNLAGGRAQYVLEIDAQRNALIVGPDAGLNRRGLLVSHVNWLVPTRLPAFVTARARYAAPDAPALLRPHADGADLIVEFQTPQRASAVGQVVAFYDGDRVLGGGIVERAEMPGEEMRGNEQSN